MPFEQYSGLWCIRQPADQLYCIACRNRSGGGAKPWQTKPDKSKMHRQKRRALNYEQLHRLCYVLMISVQRVKSSIKWLICSSKLVLPRMTDSSGPLCSLKWTFIFKTVNIASSLFQLVKQWRKSDVTHMWWGSFVEALDVTILAVLRPWTVDKAVFLPGCKHVYSFIYLTCNQWCHWDQLKPEQHTAQAGNTPGTHHLGATITLLFSLQWALTWMFLDCWRKPGYLASLPSCWAASHFSSPEVLWKNSAYVAALCMAALKYEHGSARNENSKC